MTVPMNAKTPIRLRVAVTRALPPPVIDLLRQRHDLWVNPHDRTLSPDELQRAAKEADALIITAFDRLHAAASMIAAGPAGRRRSSSESR